MTFKERYWAYVTRRDSRIAMLSTVLIMIAVLLVEVNLSSAFFLLVLFGINLVPPLFYAAAKIDPHAEHLGDSFLIRASWPLAIAYIFWVPFFLVGYLLSTGGISIYYTAFIIVVVVGWHFFIRVKLREEFRPGTKTQQ